MDWLIPVLCFAAGFMAGVWAMCVYLLQNPTTSHNRIPRHVLSRIALMMEHGGMKRVERKLRRVAGWRSA